MCAARLARERKEKHSAGGLEDRYTFIGDSL